MSVIETRLAAVEARLAAIESRLASGAAPSSSGSRSGGGAVASDDDLDSEWGDEVIKKDPKKWVTDGGDSFVGCRMSECPSDYLRMLASLFDWMADKDEQAGKTYTNKHGKEVPVAPINRKKAARARGWAKRNEGKSRAPAASSAPVDDPFSGNGGGSAGASDDDIPFVYDATIFGRRDRP